MLSDYSLVDIFVKGSLLIISLVHHRRWMLVVRGWSLGSKSVHTIATTTSIDNNLKKGRTSQNGSCRSGQPQLLLYVRIIAALWSFSRQLIVSTWHSKDWITNLWQKQQTSVVDEERRRGENRIFCSCLHYWCYPNTFSELIMICPRSSIHNIKPNFLFPPSYYIYYNIVHIFKNSSFLE